MVSGFWTLITAVCLVFSILSVPMAQARTLLFDAPGFGSNGPSNSVSPDSDAPSKNQDSTDIDLTEVETLNEKTDGDLTLFSSWDPNSLYRESKFFVVPHPVLYPIVLALESPPPRS